MSDELPGTLMGLIWLAAFYVGMLARRWEDRRYWRKYDHCPTCERLKGSR